MNERNRRYYEAYDERYKTIHQKGLSWAGNQGTPIVMETIRKHGIDTGCFLLEIGCGEGRDSRVVLENGYDLMASDISKEAIDYCRKIMPEYADSFCVLDCLSDECERNFDFIYAVAVIHMLVRDEDRNGFYKFIRDHLKDEGIALVCSMGDGSFEMQSDITQAFDLQEREHESGKIAVAATSCRMVSFKTFEEEISRNGLEIIEEGITEALPDFDSLMYAVVRKKQLNKVFESERISYAEVSELLIDDYLKMINDNENVNRFLGTVNDKVYDENDEVNWIQDKLAKKAPVFSMIEKATGRFIGNTELVEREDNVRELGIALTYEMQDRGFGSEAVKTMIKYGFDVLGLDKITLRAKPFNARALHVYEKCGFREYDRDEDHVYMEILNERQEE